AVSHVLLLKEDCSYSFFFQAEDGIRDGHVTGVQTCALPIFCLGNAQPSEFRTEPLMGLRFATAFLHDGRAATVAQAIELHGGEEIGRASCRERGWIGGGGGGLNKKKNRKARKWVKSRVRTK